jgi:site-specific recombinase XerD
MASVHARGKKGTWHASWRDAQGTQCRETTGLSGEKNRKKALEIAEGWEREARVPLERRTVQRVQRVNAEIHRRYTGEICTQETLESYAETWFDVLKPSLKPASQVKYEAVKKSLVESVTAVRGVISIQDVEKKDIVRWRNERLKQVAKTTANTELKIVRMIFLQALEDEIITSSPASSVSGSTVTDADLQHPEPIGKAKLSELLEVCTPEWQSMVVHGYYTGQRLKDIALMKHQQVDPLSGQVRFVTGKRQRVVIIEMPKPYLDWFLERPTSDNPKSWIHPECAAAVLRSKGETVGTLSNQFARFLFRAGLREHHPNRHVKEGGPGRKGRRQRQPHSYHVLRSMFVSDLANSGVDQRIVMDMVGHSSVAVNNVYTKLGSGTKAAAMKNLPNITPADRKQLEFFDKLGADAGRKPAKR